MPHAAGLWYEWHGPEDEPPLILSSGLGGSGTYWAPNLDAFVEHFHVLTYDHRGTGRSDRVLPPNLTVRDMANDLHRLMTGIGIPHATIIGHAAGAAIGLELALNRPEAVDRLVIINGWAAPDPYFIRCMEARLALLRGSGVQAFVRAQPIFLYPAGWISEHDARLNAEEEGHIAHFQGAANVEARIAALAAFDVEQRLGDIRAPVLLIVAQDDMLVPALCSDRLAKGLRDATLMPMLGGHACNITEPLIFDKLLRGWLSPARLQGAA